MCVIAFVEPNGVRPSPDDVKIMFEKNNQGAGIAWLDGKKTVWNKGLNLDEVTELVAKVPLPFVVHFRVSSCGDGGSRRLTHPFLVSADSKLDLTGSTTVPLLFHNGTWGNWENKTLDFACKGGYKLPDGKWSDSRAMAWLAHHMGFGILELINEKVILFGPGLLKMYGKGWKHLERGYWVSNDWWLPTGQTNFQGGPGYHTQVPASLTSQKPSGKTSTTCDSGIKDDVKEAVVMGPTGGSLAESPFVRRFEISKGLMEAVTVLTTLERVFLGVQEKRQKRLITKPHYKALKALYKRRKKDFLMQAHLARVEALNQTKLTTLTLH